MRQQGKKSTAATRRLAVACCLAVAAPAAQAQFTQYTIPGSLANTAESRRQQLEKGVAEARWRLGPVLINPVLTLRNVGYDDNVFSSASEEDQVSDFRATVGAGVDAFVRLGGKGLLSTSIRPEYTWWREQDELSQLNVNYGAGVHGFFNRLTVSLEGRSVERERPLNVELEIPVQVLEEQLDFSFEVDLRGPLGVFGSVTDRRVRHDDGVQALVPGIELALLDRDEESVRAGVLWDLTDNLTLGVGVDETTTDFLVDPGGRSNSGTSPLVRLEFSGTRLRAVVTWIESRIDFAGGDAFEDSTGTGVVTLPFGASWTVSVYAARNLVYTFAEANEYFVEERFGTLVERAFGSSLRASVFAESGDSSFATTDLTLSDRVDDFDGLGASLTLRTSQRFGLRFQFSRIRFDSTDPLLDRTTTRLGVSLDFDQDLLR